jgi:hypothetical protein
MNNSKHATKWGLWAAAFILLAWFAAAPNRMQAQNTGDNAVGNGGTVTNSKAFIDASAFEGLLAPVGDLCSVLNYIYSSANTANPIPPTGAVIDARGIAVGIGAPCANTNPWPTSGTVPPTTVLLPAGTIEIVSTWQVPSGTHIIGERRNTNIYPSTSFTGSYMIEMGPSSCTAGSAPVVIEDVTLEGASSTPYPDINGIDNECSGAHSYIDHVIIQLAGIGLHIASGASGSGPYSNINYIADKFCYNNLGETCPSRCVEISAQTRGIRGMTCTMYSTSSSTNKKDAAVLLDGVDNVIEDVHFEGFYNGILVGDTAIAAGSSLINVTSGTGQGPTVNAIHICNPGNPATSTSCTAYTVTSTNTPGDITISQVVNNTVNNTGTNAYSAALILDDLTSTAVGVSPGSSIEYTAGIYAVGRSMAGGYSRFSTTNTNTSSQTSTNPATPVWATASLGASQLPETPCPIGSIFSNAAGTTGSKDTIYVCQFNSGGTATQWTGLY